MRIPSYAKRGFTLIELLTVIAIIGVLAALLFPAIKSALLKAEKNKTEAAISALATAFRSYHTEYGKWPVSTLEQNGTAVFMMKIDAQMVSLLQGNDITAPPYQGNPRKIVFLEIKAKDLDASGAYLDPWGGNYWVTFDTEYNNQVRDPYAAPTAPQFVNTGFIISSYGPDRQWDAAGGSTSIHNKDNVNSW